LGRLAAQATLATLTAAAPAAAEDPYCEDWWFARNLIFDRAGYCFATPLGQALFDNSDCTTTAPTLSPPLAARVARIRALEAEFACAVDTTRPALTYPETLEPYRKMADIPIKDFADSGCIGYRGPEVTLHDAARADAPVIGRVEPGVSIGFGHYRENGFDYVTIIPMDGDAPLRDEAFAGWGRFGPQPLPCDGYAG
jgi:hypothetical protein